MRPPGLYGLLVLWLSSFSWIFQWTKKLFYAMEIFKKQCGQDNRACSVAQSCLTLSNSMDCSPQGSSVHGISQAGILEWIAIPFSRESSWSRDWTCVSCIGKQVLCHWASGKSLTVGIVPNKGDRASNIVTLALYLLANQGFYNINVICVVISN